MTKRTVLSIGIVAILVFAALAVYAATDANQAPANNTTITSAKACGQNCGKNCESCEDCDGNCENCEGCDKNCEECENCDGNCKKCEGCDKKCEKSEDCVKPCKDRKEKCGGIGPGEAGRCGGPCGI